MPTNPHPNISSAEMTAAWRSQYPTISHDTYSHLLVSQTGYDKAQDYCKHEYPQAALQMSLANQTMIQLELDNNFHS